MKGKISFVMMILAVAVFSTAAFADEIECDPENPQCPEGETCQLYDDEYYCGFLPICGDGSVNQGFEQCDDGNNVNGDGCDERCQIENNHEIPEFTTIGAGLALAGIGAYMYRRRRH